MSPARRAIVAAAIAAKRVAGVEVLYGGFPVTAVLGTTSYLSTENPTGVEIVCQARDYLIIADELQPLLLRDPEEGDQIVETAEDGSQHTYEVNRLPQEPCWRWNDPHRVRRRIHTKEIDHP